MRKVKTFYLEIKQGLFPKKWIKWKPRGHTSPDDLKGKG